MTAAAASSSFPLPLPIFNGENYEFWKIKMRTLLRSQSLWRYVDVGYYEPNNEERLSVEEKMKLHEDRVMDARALLFLQQGVTDALFPRIFRANTAKVAWEILEREFHGEIKTGHSQLKSQEFVRYTRDQLLQLREVVGVPEDVLKIKQEVEAKLYGKDQSHGCRERNRCIQVGSHYPETVKHECHGCSTKLLTAGEERSWESLQEIGGFTGVIESRLQGTKQSDRQYQISLQLGEEPISSEQMGEQTEVLMKVEVPQPAQMGNLSKEEWVLKTAKQILNMHRPEKFNLLKGHLIFGGVASTEILKGVVSLILDKMILEPTLCPMYAELCSDLAEHLPSIPPEEPSARPVTFRRILLYKCQALFEGADSSTAEVRRQMTDHDQELECMVRENMVKLRTIGVVHFLGELLKQGMIIERTAHRIVHNLLGQPGESCPAGEKVEAVCLFLSTVGEQLDGNPWLVNDTYFNRLKALTTNPQLPPHVQLMILGVLHLRANNWVP